MNTTSARVPHRGASIRFGEFSLDMDAYMLGFRGQRLALDADAAAVLHLAASAAGDTVPEARLLAAFGKNGRRQLHTCVAGLNLALATWAPDAGHLAHFPNHGYALLLPARAATPIDCTEVAGRVAARLREHRFVSIVGPGGMGKTTVAQAVAAALAGDFSDGACFVDLAPLAEPRWLANAVAQALGLAAAPGGELARLVAFLAQRRLLLVLDGCEHLVTAAAALAEHLLRAAPGLTLLATTREPLLATGEWLFRLGAMRLPPRTGPVTPAQAMAYGGIALFVLRARERQPDFTLDAGNVAQVCALCHRLDGIPLALELAAARVGSLGVAALAGQVGARMLALVNPRRSAAVRHRTLAAMLDWSYDLLPPAEQQALVRLALFRGEFTLEAAAALIAAEGAPDTLGGAECILELASKSLVAIRADALVCRYRLLDTTRAYAAGKLDASGGRGALQARHGQYLCRLMAAAEADWLVLPRVQWIDKYKIWIDDIRVTLDWAYAAGGDVTLGHALLIAAFPLGHQASLTAEFAERIGVALARAPRGSAIATLLATQLHGLLCNVTTPAHGAAADLAAIVEAAGRALPGDALYKHRTALAASSWTTAFLPGEFPVAVAQAGALLADAVRTSDGAAEIVARRMQAQALHFMGRHAESQSRAEQVLARADYPMPLACSPAHVNVRISMRLMLARSAWMCGRPAEARDLAAEALHHASGDTAVALAQALAVACIPVALWDGDIGQARALVARLVAHARSHSLDIWMAWGGFFQQMVAHADGDTTVARQLTARTTRGLDNVFRDHMVTFHRDLVAPDCLARVRAEAVAWNAPEMWRALGERCLRRGQEGAARRHFDRSLSLARAQGAVAWELRTAISVAVRWREKAPLEALVARFDPAVDNADLRAGRAALRP